MRGGYMKGGLIRGVTQLLKKGGSYLQGPMHGGAYRRRNTVVKGYIHTCSVLF